MNEFGTNEVARLQAELDRLRAENEALNALNMSLLAHNATLLKQLGKPDYAPARDPSDHQACGGLIG